MFIAPGKSIHSNNCASAMCDRGHMVHFVTQESFTENQYSFVNNVDNRFIIHRLPFSGKMGYALNVFALKRITKEINPDIIHVHQAAGYGFLGTFSDKKIAIVSVYGWEVYDLIKSKFWKHIINYIIHWYRHIGSTSYCMRKQILKVFPNIQTPIVVTPFGIDLKKFKNQHIKKDEIIIGTVKKMDRKYGIEYLVRAFAKTVKDIQKIQPELAEKLFLELVGPGNQIDKLKELAQELGIIDKVQFIGRVPHSEVPNWLNRFDIYSAPSIFDSESFGVAVIEASSCGCPVVVSNVGGLSEVVENGVTGYIVPPKDSDALAGRLKELVLNPELRIKMGEAGINLVKKRYDWTYCVDLIEQIYQSIKNGSYQIKYQEDKYHENMHVFH